MLVTTFEVGVWLAAGAFFVFGENNLETNCICYCCADSRQVTGSRQVTPVSTAMDGRQGKSHQWDISAIPSPLYLTRDKL